MTLYFKGCRLPVSGLPAANHHTLREVVSPRFPRAQGLACVAPLGSGLFGPLQIQVVCAGWLREHRDRHTQPNRVLFISPQRSAFIPAGRLQINRGTRRPGMPGAQHFLPPGHSFWSSVCISMVWSTKGDKCPVWEPGLSQWHLLV